MKEAHHPRKILIMFTTNKSTKASLYLLLLLLSYILGFYTGKHLNKQNPTQLPEIHVELPPYPDLLRFRTLCSDPVPSKLVRKTILDRIFNGNSPFQSFPPAHASPLLRRKRIKGWGSTGPVFETLIRKVQPKTIIEIGSFLGASAIHMAELTRKLNLRTQILCIDDFRGWPGFRDRFRDISSVNGDVLLMYQFMQNVGYVNRTEEILPVPFSTNSALSWLCELGVYGYLIEVDAGHDFHSAWADINMAYAILRPGGVMFGHDYFTGADDRGVRRAVNLFARVKGLRVELDGQHWVIGSS
ncbi:S-adenosyl-L-methionine-dependent methyltransferases superfamily protein [Tasmannia lanceolata]|uniref:S-adenosyl-L-methionine-dependent methyltransferases superfamily protein n=1 Tax=Tasmannia lanceolata TaxID=3420 RepID=UPI0040629529